jgi:hypothetical protein
MNFGFSTPRKISAFINKVLIILKGLIKTSHNYSKFYLIDPKYIGFKTIVVFLLSISLSLFFFGSTEF